MSYKEPPERVGVYIGRPSISPVVVGLLQTNVIGRDATVLDLGSGSGLDSVYLARWGCRVVAVELNPYLRSAARRRVTRARVSGSLTALAAPFPSGTKGLHTKSIDAIIDTLCWTNIDAGRSADRMYAEEAWRLLKPMGLFVLHMRPPSHEVPIICRPERWLPLPFLRYFRWSRFVLTHLAENRAWAPLDARKRRGHHLPYDHATVYVGIGRPVHTR